MPSQLLKNDAVSFIVCKDVVFDGVQYHRGQDFDQDSLHGTLNNIETMVRARFLIPVVDNLSDKPRHWYREIKQRDQVLARLEQSGTTTTTGDTPVAPLPEEPETAPDTEPDYDPAGHIAVEVMAYATAHRDQVPSIIEKEKAGKARSTLLTNLEKLLPKGE